ncbi:MAG TPA: class I SAM-dependent methyltransferase [Edaphocola sp.]|nr:class I SAM-dependent methyltransferase [Edaphocola sp.]
MTEFWEKAFKDKQEMWGFSPAKSTLLVNNFFIKQNVKSVLIPGIGYGRNAKIFKDNGMNVTGIEISQTAIDLAQKHFGKDLTIYHGSVTEMPFDKNLYDGIYCYALIHFLDKKERGKFIQDCLNQLTANGCMVFATISKKAQIYGHGTFIKKDRYELFSGLKMFFYDEESIQEEFSNAGLFDILEVDDVYPFYLIFCKKASCPKIDLH